MAQYRKAVTSPRGLPMKVATLTLAIVANLIASGILAAEIDVQHADLKIALPDQPTKDVAKIGGKMEPNRAYSIA